DAPPRIVVAMSDDLFARLDAIGQIIGGKDPGAIATLEPEADPGIGSDSATNTKTPGTFAGADFTGGTMTEAHGDSHGETPGARALQNLLLSEFAGGHDVGIYSDRDVRGRPGVRSVHGEGRAGDFGVPVAKGGHALGHSVAD